MEGLAASVRPSSSGRGRYRATQTIPMGGDYLTTGAYYCDVEIGTRGRGCLSTRDGVRGG